MPTPDWFAALLGGSLTQLQVQQLYTHYETLVRWNQRMNLTTIQPGPEMVTRHYCESLFLAAHLPVADQSISLLDLGSGAGFPGVPSAIAKPSWRVTLVESHKRKAVFLRESTRDLPNVSIKAERIENLSIPADWAVARAVDPWEVIKNIPRLATKVGLMIGEDDFSAIQSDSRIAWREPIRLPWGDRRLCVYGTFRVEP